MENDVKENQEYLININKNYFKLDFSKQKLKGNREFEEYKKLKLNELGKDAKLFHCKKDNLYFYVSKIECKTLPYYFKKCPLCYNYICYFCERNTYERIGIKGNCSINLALYYSLIEVFYFAKILLI